MKKKTKVIIGSTAILSIASIVIGCSLACVQYNQTKANKEIKKASTVAKTLGNQNTMLANYTSNNQSLNDHAYLQTLNQQETVNPLGKP